MGYLKGSDRHVYDGAAAACRVRVVGAAVVMSLRIDVRREQSSGEGRAGALGFYSDHAHRQRRDVAWLGAARWPVAV